MLVNPISVHLYAVHTVHTVQTVQTAHTVHTVHMHSPESLARYAAKAGNKQESEMTLVIMSSVSLGEELEFIIRDRI